MDALPLLIAMETGIIATIIIGLLGSLAAGIGLIISHKISKRRQKQAFLGDDNASSKLILPCYRPLYRLLIGLYFFFSFIFCISFTWSLSMAEVILYIEYYTLCILAIYSIAPVLLIQKSGISTTGFWNTFYIVGYWYAMNSFIWLGCVVATDMQSKYSLQILFAHFVSFPLIILGVGVLTKRIPSRIQLGSRSNRASVEFLVLFALAFYIISISFAVYAYRQHVGSTDSELFTIAVSTVLITLIWNVFFPLSLYRTLVADTKYWRGLGKHNQFKIKDESNGTQSAAVVNVNVAAFSVQSMMSQFSENCIDFALVEFNKSIGVGSTSTVYSGYFSKKTKKSNKNIHDVAIKLITPAELTPEVLEEFSDEAITCAELSNNTYIVGFFGWCIRPPKIAMVLELCEQGDLLHLLLDRPDVWSPQLKLTMMLHAIKALAWVHKHNYIHRDIKTENFFLSADNVLKLGDFGEAIKDDVYADDDGKMPIVGTINYMAPELITGAKKYTNSVDIYALAIVYWELWHMEEAYKEMDAFKVYEFVKSDNRPKLNSKIIPQNIQDIVINCWPHNPLDRLTSCKLVEQVQDAIKSYISENGSNGFSFSEKTFYSRGEKESYDVDDSKLGENWSFKLSNGSDATENPMNKNRATSE